MIAPHPFSSMFISTLLLSTFMALSSNNWIIIWASMELNLLSMLPLMTLTSSNQESEAAMKYFFAQAIGSATLLAAIIPSFSPQILSLLPSHATPALFMFSILIKAGAAPCHFWLPNVMASLNWPQCLVLATWQKIIPVWLMMHIPLFHSSFMPLYVGALGALIGGAGGMNQTQLRPLLAYSSINHTGWIIATSALSTFLSFAYFIIYVASLTPIMLAFSIMSMKLVPQTSSFSALPPNIKMSLMALFLSLGGLPPLLGFMPKMFSLLIMASNSLIIIPIILILGSLMSLYYYLTILFNLSLKSLTKITSPASPTMVISPYIFPVLSMMIFMPLIFSFLYALIIFH